MNPSGSIYTRENPSPRFQLLGKLYEQAHEVGGLEGSKGTTVFAGRSLIFHVETVSRLAKHTGAKSVLDYGCGKAQLYSERNLELPEGKTIPSVQEYWGVDEVALYDPGVSEYSTLPTRVFDGVVSTDVLEHIPEEDVDWVLKDCFSFAKKFIYMNIASYPARKILPNGWNAHVTIESPDWWRQRILKAAAGWSGKAYVFDVTQRMEGWSGWLRKRIKGTRTKITRIENWNVPGSPEAR